MTVNSCSILIRDSHNTIKFSILCNRAQAQKRSEEQAVTIVRENISVVLWWDRNRVALFAYLFDIQQCSIS